MKIFDTTPKGGEPVRSKMFFTALIRMARAWEYLKVHNGHVDWSNGMPTIVVDEIEKFSGNVWVGGKKLTVPTTGLTQYLSVPLDGTSACSWVAAMPDEQMPSDAEIFDTSQTAGDIHLPSNFGGG
jgi:hypothetical protein